LVLHSTPAGNSVGCSKDNYLYTVMFITAKENKMLCQCYYESTGSGRRWVDPHSLILKKLFIDCT
jgi:hypothetical protein